MSEPDKGFQKPSTAVMFPAQRCYDPWALLSLAASERGVGWGLWLEKKLQARAFPREERQGGAGNVGPLLVSQAD